MKDEEFDAFLERALVELGAKQTALSDSFGIGGNERFVVDYSSRLLTFFVGEAPTAEAFILPLGTHSLDKQRFRWSWSDEGLPMDVRDASRKTEALYDLTGFEIFSQATFQCDQTMAWEIAALSCSALAADGAYRIPNGSNQHYVLILSVRRFPVVAALSRSLPSAKGQ
ncbi:hypothetical protein KDX05_21835 [Burkholderia vietnamiensis]|uniref:DUF6882 domain-containing protein n=1 Tax=Burkholderia vietnamiensis TaxID=60552 RepID=UPI001B96742D|nr:DUF6882 domain-containing protein [Burkholderia vietnamiensis]MBR8191691.1 hypothetical protein [Burkholderia vietnamiensis]MBR8230951.1 hypothetical protein [Burkholderia vietnamiensis]